MVLVEWYGTGTGTSMYVHVHTHVVWYSYKYVRTCTYVCGMVQLH